MTTLQDFIELRQRLGYSQEEVAEALGLYKRYIYRVERGEREYRHIYYLALLGMASVRSDG